jgi:hypothetical protein
MSNITGAADLNLPPAVGDFEGDLFKISGGKITGKTINEVPPGSPGLMPSPPSGTPANAVPRADGSWAVPAVPPATTNTLAASKAAGIVSTVDGVAATVAIAPGVIVDQLGFDSTGNLVSAVPVASATTHVNSWTKAGGLKETVNGVASDIAIPAGTIADAIGYDATGKVVYAPMLATPSVRQYYTNTTVYVPFFATAQTAATIASRGFTMVGAGTVIPANTGFAQYIATNPTTPTLANHTNIPTSYLRHEVAVTAGVSNAYHIKLRTGLTPACADVWVCNPVSGVPVQRLASQSAYKVGASGDGISLYLGPTEDYGVWNNTWEWVQFYIPESVIATFKTAGNTIKLALRPGIGNGGAYLDIGGYAMAAVGNSAYTVATAQMWDQQMNGGSRLTQSGNVYGHPYSAVQPSTSYNPPYTWPANLTAPGMRIPLTGVDRDVYLSLIAPSNLEYLEQRGIALTLIHSSGNVYLDRGKVTQKGPLAQLLIDGPRSHSVALGWLIPASVLAAKAVTPTNSAVPYLEIGFTNFDTGTAYVSGAVVTTA